MMLPLPALCRAALPVACAATIYFRCQTPVKFNSTNTVTIIMVSTSTVLAAAVMFARYRQVGDVCTLTWKASLIQFLNKVALFSANFMILCFLFFATFFINEVNNISSTVEDIFVYGFGTLYIWIQCIITNYLSPLYYSKNLTLLRLCLASVSFLLLLSMVLSGILANALRDESNSQSSNETCLVINTFCHHASAVLFCVLLLSFETDCKHLNVCLRADLLLDDRVSLCTSYPDISQHDPPQIFTYTANLLKNFKPFAVS